MYLVAGTQADNKNNNSVMLMKLSDMCKTKEDFESDDDGAFSKFFY